MKEDIVIKAVEQTNIILIGMPGSGKTTAAGIIGRLTGRKVYDCDEAFTERYGKTPREVIVERGEPEFRDMETEVLRELTAQRGIVIATGGGVVVRRENYPLLKNDSIVISLKRDISRLAIEGRPITQMKGKEALYKEREPLYEMLSDIEFDMDADDAEGRLEELLGAVSFGSASCAAGQFRGMPDQTDTADRE